MLRIIRFFFESPFQTKATTVEQLENLDKVEHISYLLILSVALRFEFGDFNYQTEKLQC